MSEALDAIRHKRADLHREYTQFKESKYWDRIVDFLFMEAAAQRELACDEQIEEWKRANGRAMARALKKMVTLPRDMFDNLDAGYELQENQEKEELAIAEGDPADAGWGEGSDSTAGL
jgi:hypothetical protein